MSIGAALVLAGLFLPEGSGLARNGLVTLSLLCLAILFWATETVEPTITSLIVLALLPTLGALSYSDAFAGMGQQTIWRLIGILIVTLGLSSTGLDRRLALAMLRLARGNVYAMLVLMMILADMLVFVIPTPMARTSLLATVFVGILQGLGIKPPSNIAKIVFIGIPTFTLLTSATLITGASVEVYAVGLFSTLLDYHFSYVSWMLLNLPITFISCALVLPVLIRLYPPEVKHIEGADALLNKELAQMGRLTLPEKKMILLLGILIAMWLTGISDKLPAEVMIATLLFVPGIGILKWGQAQKQVSWGTVILYGSSLSLALALQQNKVVQWAADLILAHMTLPAPPITALLTILLVTAVSFGMTNMTGSVMTVFPLVTTLAATAGLNPVWLGMICVISSSTGFFLPSQSASNLMTYSLGYFSIKEMAWAGLWTSLIVAAVMISLATLYWPLVGVPIFGK